MFRAALLLLAVPALAAAQPDKLTIDRVFASADFAGEYAPAMRWLDGGAHLALEPSASRKGTDIVRTDAAGKKEVLVPADKLVPAGAKDPLGIEGYEFSADFDVVLISTNTARVWRANTRGDYYTFRRSTGKLAKLGGDAKPSTLQFAKLSPDGSRVGYVRGNNLYVQPTDGGTPVALTTDGTDEIINGTFDWVYEEEFSCRDGWRWSPDGKRIAFWQLDTRGVKTFTLIDYTASTYPKLTTFAYPKAGERNSLCRVGVVPAAGGPTKWIDVPGDTKTDFYIPRMEWAGNANDLVVQRVNRLQNGIDVMLADATTGKVRTVHSDRDGAWVDVHDDAMQWIEKGTAFTWISERDGWRQLFVVSRDGANVRKVTRGEYDVIKVLHVDEKGGWVHFAASPDKPTQRYLYRVRLDGTGSPERLTPADKSGWHEYDITPDGTRAVHTFSTFDTPPRVELISLPDHKTVRVVAANDKLRDTVSKLGGTPVEFFRAAADDGTPLDGWLIKPPGFDASKKYPLFFYVYGEPWGQEATDRWHGRQALWFRMLAQQGYVVACVDNRGTPCPRGRDWRKSVYRQIGTLAAADQAAACRELLKRPYLDAARVGVWGWSGGGSMTLNLLFRYPDLYRTGMSVAPVPDVHLYDTIYQERYMGLPQHNPDDYKKSSPITHAAGLRGNLLIVHGTGDDNCHYQGVEKLADALIGLNKPFTLMPYPNRSHSIHEGKNTTRHLYSLLTRYLNENLPAGPR